MKQLLKHIGGLIGAVLLWVGLSTGSASAQTITYFHNDISGSPMLATDASGEVLWKENYRPYGDKLNRQAASSDNKIGYHGKPYDDNTGMSAIKNTRPATKQ